MISIEAGWLIDFLFCFLSRLSIFHTSSNITIAHERLQKLDLCSASTAFSRNRRDFIEPYIYMVPRSILRKRIWQYKSVTNPQSWQAYFVKTVSDSLSAKRSATSLHIKTNASCHRRRDMLKELSLFNGHLCRALHRQRRRLH